MAVIEIVGGVILLVVSVVIFALTLMQHTHCVFASRLA